MKKITSILLVLLLVFSAISLIMGCQSPAVTETPTTPQGDNNPPPSAAKSGRASIQSMNVLVNGDTIQQKVLDRYNEIKDFYNDSEELLAMAAVSALYPRNPSSLATGEHQSLKNNYIYLLENKDEVLAKLSELGTVDQAGMAALLTDDEKRIQLDMPAGTLNALNDSLAEIMNQMEAILPSEMSSMLESFSNEPLGNLSALTDIIGELYTLTNGAKGVWGLLHDVCGTALKTVPFVNIALDIFEFVMSASQPSPQELIVQDLKAIHQQINQIVEQLGILQNAVTALYDRMALLNVQMDQNFVNYIKNSMRNNKTSMQTALKSYEDSPTEAMYDNVKVTAQAICLNYDDMIAQLIEKSMQHYTSYLSALKSTTNASLATEKEKVFGANPSVVLKVKVEQTVNKTIRRKVSPLSPTYEVVMDNSEVVSGFASMDSAAITLPSSKQYLPTSMELLDVIWDAIAYRLQLVDTIFNTPRDREVMKNNIAKTYMTNAAYVPALRTAVKDAFTAMEQNKQDSLSLASQIVTRCNAQFAEMQFYPQSVMAQGFTTVEETMQDPEGGQFTLYTNYVNIKPMYIDKRTGFPYLTTFCYSGTPGTQSVTKYGSAGIRLSQYEDHNMQPGLTGSWPAVVSGDYYNKTNKAVWDPNYGAYTILNGVTTQFKEVEVYYNNEKISTLPMNYNAEGFTDAIKNLVEGLYLRIWGFSTLLLILLPWRCGWKPISVPEADYKISLTWRWRSSQRLFYVRSFGLPISAVSAFLLWYYANIC